MTAGPASPAADAPRPPALRVARLHLRMGALTLARAELEALAGRGALDAAALVDLAEARWRTGDLAGAGEAADALLASGADDPLALVIAAEAVAAAGRPSEARRLASRAGAALAKPLEEVFAGMPRSLIWPVESPEVAAATRARDAIPEGYGAHGEHLLPAGAHAEAFAAPPDTPANTAAAEAYAGGRAALAGGDVSGAARRLAVAIRLDPAFAPEVLALVDERPEDPALLLVAGDALRLLGREADALAAYEAVRRHDDA